MRFIKTTVAVSAIAALLSLAACGGDDPAPTSTASAAGGASAPVSASAPVPASSPAVTQTQVFTAVRSSDAGLTGEPALVTFPAASATGFLTINSASYATLTPDAANDGAMTVSGTPLFGVTLGVIPSQIPVLFPGIIEACEADPAGPANPSAGNATMKSKVVAVAGLPITNISVLVNTYPTYYEDCLRDGLPTAPATHSSMIIDGGGNVSIFDARTNATTVIPAAQAAGEVSSAGHNGDWLMPFLYITADGQRHIAVLQHGTAANGNPRGDYVGIWLAQ
jgi:hypothetical protein